LGMRLKILKFIEITKRKKENSDMGCAQNLRQSRLLEYHLDSQGVQYILVRILSHNYTFVIFIAFLLGERK